jgi:Family of unknown function (DUF5362)
VSEQPTDRGPVTESSAGATGGIDGMASLTPLARQYLDETRPWVRFISTVTFVMAGFMVLMGVGVVTLGVFGGLAAKNTGGLGALGSAIGGGVLALVYVVLAFVYIAPGVYLARYASAIKRLRANCNAGGLEDALKHQKSFWRFAGILTAVGLVVAVVGMVLAIVAGVIAAVMAARS